MNWIKKHYDQFALGVFALALIGFSVFIIINAAGFGAAFSEMTGQSARVDRIKPLDLNVIADARQRLSAPTVWQAPKSGGSLFVSNRYIIDPATKLPRRLAGNGGSLHPPVPDDWLLKYEQNVLASNVLNEDPDKDGFTNLEEYLGADRKPENGELDATDPTNPKSHPPYHTKLVLKRYIKVPFRLLFSAYDGDPKKDAPEKMEFQINTLDLRQPTEFLKIGDVVRNTKFKLEKFQFKERLNESTGVEQDISELTLRDTELDEPVVLVLTKVTDSPDSYAIFSYTWPSPAQDIRVRKLQYFALRPAPEVKYKLIDINETEALIALPSGQKYSVTQQPR